MSIGDGELAVVSGGRVRLTLSPGLMLSIVVGAASIVGSVWLATRDLGHEVQRLSMSVDALVSRLESNEQTLDEHDRRIWQLEAGASAGGAR